MDSRIRVGSKVCIVNNGSRYTAYKEWAIRNHFVDYKEFYNSKNGDEGIVEVIAPHGNYADILLGVNVNGTKVIIGEEGVKFVETPVKATTKGEKEMTKYTNEAGIELKVGDKVKVTREGVFHDPNGMGKGIEWLNSWTGAMDESIGKTFTISSISQSGVKFAEDGRKLGYPMNVLEFVTDENYPQLEAFQRVVLRNGKTAIVVISGTEGEFNLHFAGNTWTDASFKDKSNNGYEIVEVYAAPKYIPYKMLDHDAKAELIWKKENPKIKAADEAITEAINAVRAAEVALEAAKAARKALN